MIIDIDHMSQKATDTALDMAEAHDYPVISSHSWFRDLAFTRRRRVRPAGRRAPTAPATSTRWRTRRQARRPGRAHRAPGRHRRADPEPGRRARPRPGAAASWRDKVPRPCAGSSTSWAQAYLYAVEKMGGRGVAIGSDINGAAALPGAALRHLRRLRRAGDDHRRERLRRGQIDGQTNGVRYARADPRLPLVPLRRERPGRLRRGGARDLAGHRAVQGRLQPLDPTGTRQDDMPQLSLGTVDNALHMLFRQDNVDNITQGLLAADDARRDASGPDGLRSTWPAEQRAAYLVRTRALARASADDDDVRDWDGEDRSHLGEVAGDGRATIRRWSAARPARAATSTSTWTAWRTTACCPTSCRTCATRGWRSRTSRRSSARPRTTCEIWEKCEQRAAALGAHEAGLGA